MNKLEKFLACVVTVGSLCSCTSFTNGRQQGANLTAHHVPSAKEVTALENSIKMPPGAAKINSYRRYYALGDDVSSSMIWGIYIRSPNPGVSIVARDSFPSVSDGGCSVVHVRYSRVERKITVAICAGLA